MSKYDRDIQDVYAVKQLGDAIGYGHLMAIAHELWARHLEDKGLPRRGAHCAVGYTMVKEQYQAEALNDPIYTIVVGKALADRKDEQSNSEKPNNCEPQTIRCPKCGKRGYIRSLESMGVKLKHFDEYKWKCTNCNKYFKEEPKTEPQTERSSE